VVGVLDDYKYVVEVVSLDKALRVPRSVTNSLKGAVGRKLMSRMRREAVNCPVQNRLIPFLICFSCKNFIRRMSGKVYCKGQPL